MKGHKPSPKIKCHPKHLGSTSHLEEIITGFPSCKNRNCVNGIFTLYSSLYRSEFFFFLCCPSWPDQLFINNSINKLFLGFLQTLFFQINKGTCFCISLRTFFRKEKCPLPKICLLSFRAVVTNTISIKKVQLN